MKEFKPPAIPARPAFFSERKGENQAPAPSLRQLVLQFRSLYAMFREKGYFQPAFGKSCPDNGEIAGTTLLSLGEHLELTFGDRANLLHPAKDRFTEWSEADLFDMIEYLGQMGARPTHSWHHDWDGCGLHVTASDSAGGAQDWREAWDPLLRQAGYRLTAEGRIERVPDDAALEKLADTPLASGEGSLDQKLDAAIHRFHGRHASIEEQRLAVRELADILEKIRPDAKEHLASKDEGYLFDIANNFGIRHYNEKQKTDYGADEFLPFVFYSYLNAIHLCIRLRGRTAGANA